DFMLRATARGSVFHYCPEILYFYRVRPGQATTDPAPGLAGLEAVYENARGYIVDEPHRTLLRQQLARTRFGRAVRDRGLAKREALQLLWHARRTDPEVVSRTRLVAGLLLTILPAGDRLFEWAGRRRRARGRRQAETGSPSP